MGRVAFSPACGPRAGRRWYDAGNAALQLFESNGRAREMQAFEDGRRPPSREQTCGQRSLGCARYAAAIKAACQLLFEIHGNRFRTW